MSEVRYSPEAVNDLDEIWEYITFELKSREAALKTINKITDSAAKLSDFPKIGASVRSVLNVDTNYRFLVSGNYLIFYHVNEPFVYVDRILYSKRDYIKILFKNIPEE